MMIDDDGHALPVMHNANAPCPLYWQILGRPHAQVEVKPIGSSVEVRLIFTVLAFMCDCSASNKFAFCPEATTPP